MAARPLDSLRRSGASPAVLAAVGLVALAGPVAGQEPVTVTSPDGRIEVVLNAAPGVSLSYHVRFRGTTVVGESRLGLDLSEGEPLGAGLRITNVERSEHDETVRGILGKASEARDHYREATVALEEVAPPHLRLEVVLRAYDDGVALRYRVPEQDALGAFTITDERTEVALDGQSTGYVLLRDGYVSSYEGYTTVGPLADLAADALVALPLLARTPGGAWVAVTEAALTDYAGLYLSPARSGVLEARLSPWPGEPDVKVRATAPFDSPWRVVMVADDPGRLVESNLVYLLNEPTALPDVSWIQPGKTTFPWWNDYSVPADVAAAAGFTPGLNTATMKYYIDFCAENGIASHSLDGYLNEAWYGGPITPDGTPQDLTTARPEIDMPEVLRYARERGVQIRLWMHWLPLRDQIDRAFAQYEAWGIEGVMVDFMDRDDQEMVRFYHEMIEKAAAHHLTINFHGAYKPTGTQRTFPNEFNREGVLNLEYDKWSETGSTPEHEVTIPFTRMLAGPMDYHQGGFRHVTPEAFHPQFTAPLVMGTRARMLAMYVVYENLLPMLADDPTAYRGQTGLSFAAGVPAAWDETRVLHAAVGDAVTVARRSGDVWYVGSMTDGEAREVDVSLSFLGPSRFEAEVYADGPPTGDPAVPPAAVHETRLVTAADTVRVRMAPAGGHAMRLSPAPAP